MSRRYNLIRVAFVLTLLSAMLVSSVAHADGGLGYSVNFTGEEPDKLIHPIFMYSSTEKGLSVRYVQLVLDNGTVINWTKECPLPEERLGLKVTNIENNTYLDPITVERTRYQGHIPYMHIEAVSPYQIRDTNCNPLTGPAPIIYAPGTSLFLPRLYNQRDVLDVCPPPFGSPCY